VRAGALCGGLVILSLVAGCAPAAAPEAPVAPARDLIVLTTDPASTDVGRLSVTTPAGAVELARAGESTTVVAGQPPGAVAVLSDAEIQRIFGPALAVIPEAARRFNLYFFTGGDVLTPESRTLLAEVLEVVRTRVAPEVTVIGHTDTTGSAELNMALGLQRARLIREALMQEGLAEDLIDVVSHGQADLLVPTPDNTPEPRNRRVEVTVR
jgi:outer membrane protein OmpA-like peptidoglycan-associated protein